MTPLQVVQQACALAHVAELWQRAPNEWQAEARTFLAAGIEPEPLPKGSPPELIQWAADQRRKAVESVKWCSAHFVIAGVKAAQRAARGCSGEARFYAPATAIEVLQHVPREGLYWLCLGERRSWRECLSEACKRNPGAIWRRKGGYAALGERPEQREARRKARPGTLGFQRRGHGRH